MSAPKRARINIRRNIAHVVMDARGVVEILSNCHQAHRTPKAWLDSPSSCSRVDRVHMDRSLAVAQVRRRVFEAFDNLCGRCGKPVTWENGELHEIQARGKGGHISVDNSEPRCFACHRLEHAARNPQWGKKVGNRWAELNKSDC